MSLETFQMALRIISFNPITKSLGKFERRFKWLNCANIYLRCETEPTVDHVAGLNNIDDRFLYKADFILSKKIPHDTSHFYIAGL